QLIVTAHGSFDLYSKAVPIPDGVTLKFLNPHRTRLIDPGIDNLIMDKKYTLFSISNEYLDLHSQLAVEQMELLGIWAVTGEDNNITSEVTEENNNGKINIKNYILTKYDRDTPDRISNALAANRAFIQTTQKQTVRTDIATVRHSITWDGLIIPSITTIGELFNELKANDIHYDNIVCSFCRSKKNNLNLSYDPMEQKLKLLQYS
ncbi:hypothetical protein I4619_18835, partial [Proteus alimentorum]|uniref:putative adhesin n=1 Tax=Proteus alimentorum TaxID=1973495 RepID=UPI0018C51D00